MSIRVLLLTTALLVGVVVFFGSAPAQAADDDVEIAAAEVSPQGDSVVVDDSRVEVQTYTILAVVAAAGLGLLAFMVRVIMGWVKPPPPQVENSH